MAKKMKNSVKTEMKNMVQRELVRIMAKQISNEDSFKEMVQEVISDFYEEEAVVENQTSYNSKKDLQKGRLGLLTDIMNGKYKEEFLTCINKELEEKNLLMDSLVTPHKSSIPIQKQSNVELSKEQMDALFRISPTKRAENEKIDNLVFSKANVHNMRILNNINAEQASQDYQKIQCTKEISDQLFDYIENNKGNLDATHEQLHINNKSIETYKVHNKEEKEKIGNFKFGKGFTTTLNPKYFAFELEIKTNELTKQRTLTLKNITMESNSISKDVMSAKNIEKLLNIVQEIYSNTTIKPLSQTEPITEEEKRAAKKLKSNQRAKKACNTIKAKKQIQKTK